MRTFGNLLLALGALIGVLVALAMMAGVSLPSLPWLVVVGLVKLTLIASGGLIAAGAVCLRLANRADERGCLGAPETEQDREITNGDK